VSAALGAAGEERHDIRTFRPPGPVSEAFLRSREPVRFIMGPFGSGKTNTVLFDALTCGAQMPVCLDGRRRFRGLVLRDNYTNLWQTTIPSWWAWFPKTVGEWSGGEGRQAKHLLSFDMPDGAPLDFELRFLAIEQDRIENVLRGIEFTWAFMNEADLMSAEVVTYLVGRALQQRYPSKRLLPPGASYFAGVTGDMNPPDVDNWTYDLFEEKKPPGHVLFKQPSGRSPSGENHERVPPAVYEKIAETNAHRAWWVRRMVDGQWGYSRDGLPVYEEFEDDRHVAAAELTALPGVPLRLGFDQEIRGPAMVVTQWTYAGQLRILDEFVPGRMGPTEFGRQCRILLDQRYPGVPIFAATGDPAGFSGGDAENGDFSWFESVSRSLGVPILPAATNELQIRIDGVKQLLSHSVDRQPALLLSPRCKVLRKGFNSHYRIKIREKAPLPDPKPEKNSFSNPQDALQYIVLDCLGLEGVINGELAGRRGGARRRGDDDEDFGLRRGGAAQPRADFDVMKC